MTGAARAETMSKVLKMFLKSDMFLAYDVFHWFSTFVTQD
jgi:hypothetical protein